jgi:UDP-N-acetylglucosamine 1-carboxyvinyltransferase
MSSFVIEGGKSLAGDIYPQGAKNEALQILCAVLLTPEVVIIHNIPEIRDVNKLIEILADMGVKVSKLAPGSYSFQADDINLNYLKSNDFLSKGGMLRGSVMLMGPLLARFGTAIIPIPGGDKIGRRRMDTHFIGLQKLGAQLHYNQVENFYELKAQQLKGCYMLLDEASVTGTANVLMASVLAEGKTTIFNAACEPYLLQLARMLSRMGAQIEGIGSNLLQITGVSDLKGTQHTMLPDMIEIGSFIGLAAITQSDITIKNVHYQELGMIPQVFQRLGIQMELIDDDLHIPAQETYEVQRFMDGAIMTISDAPWPGFTPDLISIALVTAIQAKGSVLIHQKMFESRLFFVDKLIDMGAQIILCDPHRATVIGNNRKTPLHGIRMTSPDIRAGVALLLAALSAKGTSIIDNIEQIDRGYQQIDQRLIHLGASIQRI